MTLKTAERLRRPRKVHALDMGLRNAVVASGFADQGRLMESVVFGVLARGEQDSICYWKGRAEVDFAIQRGLGVESLIQVTKSLEDSEVAARERAALIEAAEVFPAAKQVVITGEATTADPHARPLWRFLLESSASS
jgi:predicted AAA+ superfamily ATPase